MLMVEIERLSVGVELPVAEFYCSQSPAGEVCLPAMLHAPSATLLAALASLIPRLADTRLLSLPSLPPSASASLAQVFASRTLACRGSAPKFSRHQPDHDPILS